MDAEFREIKVLFRTLGAFEGCYTESTISRGVLALNATVFKDYFRFIANRRFMRVGLARLFSNER